MIDRVYRKAVVEEKRPHTTIDKDASYDITLSKSKLRSKDRLALQTNRGLLHESPFYKTRPPDATMKKCL